MKKQINDIRIRPRIKANTEVALIRGANEVTFERIQKVKEKIEEVKDSIKSKEFINNDRRKLLKVVALSSGALIAGGILSKVDGLKNMSLGANGANSLGSIWGSKFGGAMKERGLDDNDIKSFFENFNLVKNDKEYILSNKQGENILIIDRDF